MMSATLKLRSIKDTHTHTYTHTPAGRHSLSYVCVVKMLLFSLCLSSVQNGRRKAERKSEGSRQSGITATPSPDAYSTNWLPLPAPSLSSQTILEKKHKVKNENFT